MRLVTFLLLLFVGVYAIMFVNSRNYQAFKKIKNEIPVYNEVPDFELITQYGNKFAKSDLIGNVSVLNFFFTSCPHVCPAMNTNLAKLRDDFIKKNEGVNKIQFVSVTIDPDVDNIKTLVSYIQKLKINSGYPQWYFLTGGMGAIQNFATNGLKLGIGEGSPSIHTTKAVLIDPAGKIRGYYSLMEDVQDLTPNNERDAMGSLPPQENSIEKLRGDVRKLLMLSAD